MEETVRALSVKKVIGFWLMVTVLFGVALSFGMDSEATIITDKKVAMIGGEEDTGKVKGKFQGYHDLNRWEYATLGSNSDGVYLEKVSGTVNSYKIRSANPIYSNYNYFTVSNRGYIYLNTKNEAATFVINENNTEPNLGLCTIYYNGTRVNTYSSYITVGEATGSDKTLWLFMRQS